MRPCHSYFLSVGFFTAILLLVSENCQAQNVRGNVAVQLPTFHQFGVSTTVVVPDRGSVYLGGVSRSSRGNGRFGPGVPGLGNRGFGHSTSTAGVSMSATIIDHDEIDRALLAEAARLRGAEVDIYGRPVASAPKLASDVVGQRWRRTAACSSTAVVLKTPQPTRHPRVAADADRAETYLQRGAQAEADGQPEVAAVFYHRVVKYGGAELQQAAKARLESISASHLARK